MVKFLPLINSLEGIVPGSRHGERGEELHEPARRAVRGLRQRIRLATRDHSEMSNDFARIASVAANVGAHASQ
jgi:hypothetical protein